MSVTSSAATRWSAADTVWYYSSAASSAEVISYSVILILSIITPASPHVRRMGWTKMLCGVVWELDRRAGAWNE